MLNHSTTTGAERLVLLAIAWHAGRVPKGSPLAWEAWPGTTTIADFAGLRRERTTREVLSRLVAVGALDRLVNGAPDTGLPGGRRTNLYRILLSGGSPCRGMDCALCHAPTEGPGRPDDGRPGRPLDGPPQEVGWTPDGRPQLPGETSGGGPSDGRQRKPTTSTTPKPLPPTPETAPAGAEGEPPTPGPDLVLEPTPTPNPARKAKVPQPEARPHSAGADRLARAEWERLPTKPVAGFLALRARIEEALDAGYSEGELSRALPTIKAFTRNGFDLALRQTRAAQPQHDETLDEGRELPSGEVQL